MNWLRDTILIAVAIGLLVAVLWPASAPESASDSSESTEATPGGDSMDTSSASSVDSGQPIVPNLSVPHQLFPMVAGAKWTYLVTDKDSLVTDRKWYLEIVSVPTEKAPGVVRMGFDNEDNREAPIWWENDGLQIATLPFSAPREYPDKKLQSRNGHWLPAMPYIIQDAVWTYERTGSITYRNRDANHRIIDEPATGRQMDRATVKKIEKVVVPAGVFEAYVVSWFSRFEIQTRKANRKVIDVLTAEPYKQEINWFAPGVGLVKRRVTFLAGNKQDIVFDLVDFESPANVKE